MVVAGDAGGAAALQSVVKQIRDDGIFQPKCFAYLQACKVWTDGGIDFEELDISVKEQDVDLMLARISPRLLVVGTSKNKMNHEHKFISVARRRKIKSLAVLDFWSNYRERFLESNDGAIQVPDRIAVMDERARDEMVRAGFDSNSLVVTGQPAFDDVVEWLVSKGTGLRERVRKYLGISPESLFVVFLSQPISEFHGDNLNVDGHPGYTEKTVFPLFVKGLENLATKKGRDVRLAVKLHPREHMDTSTGLRSGPVKRVVFDGISTRELLVASDLVVGMNTVLLVEACYLGCMTLSIQPGLRGLDCLPMGRLGIGYSVYREEDVEEALRRALFDEEWCAKIKQGLSSFIPDKTATENVARLIFEMVGMDKQTVPKIIRSSRMRKYRTEQESFWAGKFGDNYILRNKTPDELTMSGRMAVYSRMLARTRNVKSVIEFGPNIGANVVVMKQLMPTVEMSVVEINRRAVARLAKLPLKKIYNTSALEFKPSRQWDLVIAHGLLIHINPDSLPQMYNTLYRSSSRYVFVCEYYNPTPVAIPYRGHEGRLFKRDFAGEMLDRFSNLELVDYGFAYHRDPVFPVGDVTWFLMEKIGKQRS